jgi:hypothetical protein
VISQSVTNERGTELGARLPLGLIAPLTLWPTSAVGRNSMPKNLLILKFLYGRDRPSGFLASKELTCMLNRLVRRPGVQWEQARSPVVWLAV